MKRTKILGVVVIHIYISFNKKYKNKIKKTFLPNTPFIVYDEKVVLL